MSLAYKDFQGHIELNPTDNGRCLERNLRELSSDCRLQPGLGLPGASVSSLLAQEKGERIRVFNSQT